MGLVQKETLVVFYIRMPRDTEETSAEEVKNTGVSSVKPAVDNERRRKGEGQANNK